MSELRDKIVEIGKDYIGLGAEVYLERQCKSHLKKELKDIEKSDLAKLAEWVEKKASLVMDEDDVTDMSKEIKELKYESF